MKAMFTQVFTFFSSLLFALALASHNRTRSDFMALGKVVLYAAMYRSITIAIYYFGVISGSKDATPEFMSSHEDTVLFVDALLILGAYALHSRTKKAWVGLLVCAPLILLAIQLNNRRLAWASLGGSSPVIPLFLALPAQTRISKRVNQILLYVAPIIVIYVAVGWGSSARDLQAARILVIHGRR